MKKEELVAWRRNPVTEYILGILRETYKDRWKSIDKEDLERLQGSWEIIEGLDDAVSFYKAED